MINGASSDKLPGFMKLDTNTMKLTYQTNEDKYVGTYYIKIIASINKFYQIVPKVNSTIEF